MLMAGLGAASRVSGASAQVLRSWLRLTLLACQKRAEIAAVRGDRAGSWDRATCTIRKSAHRGFRRGDIEEMFPCTILRVIVP